MALHLSSVTLASSASLSLARNPSGASWTLVRLRHLTTVLGLSPY